VPLRLIAVARLIQLLFGKAVVQGNANPMDIQDTRRCNLWNLEKLATYLDADLVRLEAYYNEVLDDRELLMGVNARLKQVQRDYGFTRGIFARKQIDSADWFAFERILLYVLVRHLKPEAVLETGVYYGGNTTFLLAALHRNGAGRLVSIDLPDSAIRKSGQNTTAVRHPLVGDSEHYDPRLRPGFIIPGYLKTQWDFIEGNSIDEIPKRQEIFDLYLHDSDHSMAFLTAELDKALPRLSPDATIIADDIDWSNAFFSFCVERKLFPMLFTDNGKDNLRVRTGLVKLDHPRNLVPAITGVQS
jgi:predicted O-methyltransferase YrrM